MENKDLGKEYIADADYYPAKDDTIEILDKTKTKVVNVLKVAKVNDQARTFQMFPSPQPIGLPLLPYNWSFDRLRGFAEAGLIRVKKDSGH